MESWIWWNGVDLQFELIVCFSNRGFHIAHDRCPKLTTD